jgi:DNA polymerase III epsilon subunit-like protein
MDLLMFTDTETTGLLDFKLPADHPTQPRMASLAVILANAETLATVGTYFAYVYPEGWSMPQGDLPDGSPTAGKINGITDAFLQEVGVPIQNVLATLEDFLSMGVTLVGHGAEFDHKIIRGELRRLEMADYYQRTKVFCTMQKLTPILQMPNPKPNARNKWKFPKLGEAYAHYFGEAPKGAHNAMADAMHCKRLYGKMKAEGIDLTPKEPKQEGDATMAPRPEQKGDAVHSTAKPSPQPAKAESSPPKPAAAPETESYV